MRATIADTPSVGCGGSEGSHLVEEPGTAVELVAAAAGMPAGSAGIVIARDANTGEVVVRFWDGGPLTVPRESLRISGLESTRRP